MIPWWWGPAVLIVALGAVFGLRAIVRAWGPAPAWWVRFRAKVPSGEDARYEVTVWALTFSSIVFGYVGAWARFPALWGRDAVALPVAERMTGVVCFVLCVSALGAVVRPDRRVVWVAIPIIVLLLGVA